ncbi:hypothetical protein [Phenylobacterium sp. J367]|uniref:hypothetical protein n=1 Tax=Phenylobacterium sp. J367 TaxID=2898435 RepID=UPI0021512EC8|nr:hypothetical protein [Phenylobacterium sp. J367]MCR5877880.1 hypothetical protein [Phenylobacterium sp. J367]
MGKHVLVLGLVFVAFAAFAVAAGWASFALADRLGGQSLGFLAAGVVLLAGLVCGLIWLAAAAAADPRRRKREG